MYFYVYVIQSLNHDFIYVGFTHDLKKRFLERNTGQNISTKPYTPYRLIFYEAYLNEKDAIRREKYFKTTKGKVTLKQMLKAYFQSERYLVQQHFGKLSKLLVHSLHHYSGLSFVWR